MEESSTSTARTLMAREWSTTAGGDVTHAGSRLFGRRRRARRTGAPSRPVRLYRAVRDAVRERVAGAVSVDRAGQTAPWTSSAAAAGLLLLGGAAVALSPIAVGELVTSSRGDVRPGAPSTSPAPVPLPAPPPPVPAPDVPPAVPAAGPGPAGAVGAVAAPRRTVQAVADVPPAEVTVHRTVTRPDPSRRAGEDHDETDGADDREDGREDDDARESSGPAADDQDVQGESEQVVRDREKVEREREAIEAERERIEESR